MKTDEDLSPFFGITQELRHAAFEPRASTWRQMKTYRVFGISQEPRHAAFEPRAFNVEGMKAHGEEFWVFCSTPHSRRAHPFDALVIHPVAGLAELETDQADTVSAMALRQRDDPLSQVDIAIWLRYVPQG